MKKLTDKQIRLLEHLIGITIMLTVFIYRSFNFLYHMDFKDYYQWARCISLGMLPYKDFNMLQTPLSAYFSSVFFKVNGSAFCMHLLPFSICTVITVYFSVKIAVCKKTNATVFPLYIWGTVTIWCPNALYNIMSLMFWVIALYVFFCYKEDPKIYKLTLIGFITALCFYTKQNAAMLSVVSFGVIFVKSWVKNRANKQTVIKELSALWLSFILGIGTGLVILLWQGNLKEFIEYTLFPAKSFVAPYAKNPVNFILSIILIIAIFVFITIIEKKTTESEICVCAAIGTLIAFPVFNITHLMFTHLFLFIIICIFKGQMAYLRLCFVLYFAAVSIFYENYFVCKLNSVKEMVVKYENRQLYNLNTQELVSDEEIGILDYLKDKDVSKYHILDAFAGFYSIYYDRYDKYYDLFLEGNAGKKSLTDVVSDTIHNEKGDYFIIKTKATFDDYERKEWIDANDYIKENCKLEYIINENYSVYKIL